MTDAMERLIGAAQDAVKMLREDGNRHTANQLESAIAAARAAHPQPLTEQQMHAVDDEARKEFRLSQSGGPRGQMITYWDSLTPWLIRATERAHGIGARPHSARRET